MIDAVRTFATRAAWCFPLLLATLLARPSVAPAQTLALSLDGTVTAADGSHPTQAAVDAVDRATGATRHALADRRGRYHIFALAPGRYDVSARALGYRPAFHTGVAVVVGERAEVNFVLEPGAVELAPVSVVAERRVDVRHADVSTAVVADEIRDLPLNSRNVLDVAVVAPGIRSYAAEGGRSIPAASSVTGARFVNLYLDGAEMKGLTQGTLVGTPQAGSLVSQDAIREFRVLLDPYDTEYGHGAAWIISAVTWEGGNALNGSVFAFGQNRALVAKGTFEADKPPYARAQIGASLRGPIVRNRLFFAATIEQQHTDNYITVVPGRPAANPALWDSYAGTFRAPFRNDMGSLRLTAPLGAHGLDLSFTGRHLTTESGFGIRNGTVMLGREAGIAARYDVTLSRLRDSWVHGRVANELTLELLTNRSDEAALRPGPAYRYPGLQRGISVEPTQFRETHLGVREKGVVTFDALGSEHVLKLGVEAARAWGSAFQPANRDGLFQYTTDTSSLPSIATIGVGYNDSTSTRDARANSAGWLLTAYLQDQIHPVKALTLSLGVRWDADIGTLRQNYVDPFAHDTTLLRAVGDRYLNDGDRRNTLNDFAPRLSAVWDVGAAGRTFLRAGYGIMYDRVPVYGGFYEEVYWRWRLYSFTSPGTTNLDTLRRRATSAAPTLHLLPDRMKTPSTRQWSAGIGRRLAEGVALNVDYLDQHLRNAYVTVRANAAVGGIRRLTPLYGDLYLWGDFGDATYKALLTSITVDRGHSLATVAYTLSAARSEFGVVSTNDYADSAAYRMQRSEANERHRIVGSMIQRLPRRLSLSMIAVVASPRPFLATIGKDVNRNGFANDDWPNGTRTAYHGGWGNWYRTLDLRLAKSMPTGRGEVTATAELFNALDFANPAEYQGIVGNPDYRKAVGEYARRSAQAGLRYSF